LAIALSVAAIALSLGWLIVWGHPHAPGVKRLNDSELLSAIRKRIEQVQNDPRIPAPVKQQAIGVLNGRAAALENRVAGKPGADQGPR
jgi:hypothetical protein